MKSRTRCGVAALMLLAGGCGGPEGDCRDGIADLDRRMSAMIGSTGGTVPAVQTLVLEAREAQSGGDYEACVDAIGRARVELNRSQRTNQQ